MADDNQTPVFQIQRMYLKDLSLEQPNSPQILLEQAQPAVDIQLGLGAPPIADGVYEVAVTATVTTKVNDKTLFLVEAKQAGIFEIRNIPAEQVDRSSASPARASSIRTCAPSSPTSARAPASAGAAGRGELPGHVRTQRAQAARRQRLGAGIITAAPTGGRAHP